MTQVLLPIDGSDCALRGVEIALANRTKYRNPDDYVIHLVNVQAPFSGDVSRFFSAEQTLAFHEEQSATALKDASTLLDAAGAKYTVHKKVGPIAELISELADELGCDQIIMGTHGRGALREFLMGSIPLKVVQLSSLPILLVK